MTVDQGIALAASIGACLAAIATFLTVSQIAKQRSDSYRPEIVISPVLFEAKLGSIPNDWRRWQSRFESVGDKNAVERFSIPLVNIGLGSAKDVSIEWSFPIEDICEKLDSIANKVSTPLQFSYNNGAFTIISHEKSSIAILLRNE
jgi:hypothetical protein